ncbi:MAG: hypothetical protein HWE24_21295 [Oceanospirillaceae bacterium]|jgi:hypothetical protein|nr:hypothetical protein [Oceanospirillaceae bacterium]
MKNLELKRFKEKEEDVLFKVYDLLSNNGFEILIEEGTMNVWYRGCSIEMDMEEGIVIVPNEYYNEFQERQENL